MSMLSLCVYNDLYDIFTYVVEIVLFDVKDREIGRGCPFLIIKVKRSIKFV